MIEKPINSPFRYAGGKFYARKIILELLPKHSVYIEPFCGGGSIFFAKQKVEKNQLNDLDKELINTYLHIQKNPIELIESLKEEKASKERHKYFKHDFNTYELNLILLYLSELNDVYNQLNPNPTLKINASLCASPSKDERPNTNFDCTLRAKLFFL